MFPGTMDDPTPRRSILAVATALALAIATASGAAAQDASDEPAEARPSPGTLPVVVPWVDPGAPLEVLWNGDIGDSAYTWSPRIDGDGRIWTSPTESNGFRIFAPDGSLLEAWGAAGDGDGEFRSGGGPHALGIAFGSNGDIYVADTGNRRIQRFDKDRRFLGSFGSFGTAPDQFVAPVEIALDGEDNVYVLDEEAGGIKQFKPSGEFVRTVECGAPFLDVTDDGTILGFRDGVLNRCRPDGSVEPWLDLSSMVSFGTGIAVDDTGDLWVASTTTGDDRQQAEGLLHLDSAGNVLERWEVPVEGFAIDPVGRRLYATYWRQPSLAAYALPEE